MQKCEQKESHMDDNIVFKNNHFFINDKGRRGRDQGFTDGIYGIIIMNPFVISVQQEVCVRSC